MATLDDKILGEKLQNYCSSSEDEDGGGSDDDRSGDEEGIPNNSVTKTSQLPPAPANKWSGTANNTGPKGVLEDWRRFKQLEAENRVELEKERIALAKMLTLTVKPHREAQADKNTEEIEDELSELMDEDFLMQYQKTRMQELISQLHKAPKFGAVIALNTKDEFVDAIDKEDPKVTVIIHIYNVMSLACETMNGCLDVLAADYREVKFCRILADVTEMSQLFKTKGVPALLVYKGGETMGNFVQLAAELGNTFYATDVERFLIEHGVFPEK